MLMTVAAQLISWEAEVVLTISSWDGGGNSENLDSFCMDSGILSGEGIHSEWGEMLVAASEFSKDGEEPYGVQQGQVWNPTPGEE